MGADAEAVKPRMSGGPPRRRIRNYLLNPRFQLKYTFMVVAVTVVVAGVLGYFAYDYSRGLTEALSINMSMQPDLPPETVAELEGWAEREDRKVLTAIVMGILVLTLTLALTGIMVTHRLVGPAYKLRMLLNEVSAGKLRLAGRLRKGDELQEVFEAFREMVESLRGAQAEEIAQLDAAIEQCRQAGVQNDSLQGIIEVRDRMQSALE